MSQVPSNAVRGKSCRVFGLFGSTARVPLAAVAALSLSACSSDEPEMPAPRTIQTMQVQSTETVAYRRFTGEIRAVDRAQLAFEAGGVVKSINVALGDRFETDDVLATLDPTQARASADAAESALQEARSELANAAADAERYVSLRGSGAVAESRIDQAVTRRDGAGQTVKRLTAELDRARDRLDDYVLRAPYDGEVAARLAEPSDVVSAGEPVLRVTGKTAGTEAVIGVPQQTLSLVERGDRVGVRIASSAQEFDGEIVEVAGSAGRAGLVDVVIALRTDGLTPGTRVDVSVRDRALPEGVLLPAGSYQTGPGETATVFVLHDDQVRARSVRIGEVTDGGLIATEGLEPGETIAAKGASRLRDGETVRPAGIGVARYDG